MVRARSGCGERLNPTTHPTRWALLACTVALTLATLAPAAIAAAPDAFSPRRDGKARVYLIGSSTMGSVLGPMMQTSLERRWGIDARRWGKASSGLARPDYHDWPKEVPRLMRVHRPDFVVVSLGTNDNQPLRNGTGWIRIENKRWPEIYRERVREMLNLIGGEDRARRIIWLGPVALNGANARKLGPLIDKILREEIAAFDGHAEYVDVHKATRSKRGGVAETFRRPGRPEEPARTPDGVHLTTAAVQYLMERPVLDILAGCLDPRPEETVADKAPERPADAAADAHSSAESGAEGGAQTGGESDGGAEAEAEAEAEAARPETAAAEEESERESAADGAAPEDGATPKPEPETPAPDESGKGG